MKFYLTALACLLVCFTAHSQVFVDENFDGGIPAQWTVVDGGTTNDTWFGTTGGYNGNDLDGTEFVFVDSDAAGNGNDTLSESLVSPVVNAVFGSQLYLEFDQFYRFYTPADTGYVEVFDGSNWVEVAKFDNANFGGWNAPDQQTIDISAYANPNLQVRFRYDDFGTWAWFWAVDDVKIYALLPEDLGVISILAPIPSCNLGTNEQVVIQVYNYGTDTVSNIDVGYNVNGGPSVVETINQTLPPGDTLIYFFTQGVNLQASGVYTLNTWTQHVGDGDPANDSFSRMIDNVPLSAFPYNQDFENGAGGWNALGANSSWELGTPNAGFIQNAASGQNAWVTNLAGTHNNNELAFLNSPCFDFTNIVADPTISFSLIHQIEQNYDDAYLEASLDGGLTWYKIGTVGSGISWYNDANDDSWEGNSGNPGDWVIAEHVLTGTAGASVVQLRFVFESDFSVTNEGVGIDYISITPPNDTDVGVIQLVSPQDGCGDGSSVPVTIKVYNYGTSPASNFEVAYQIDGGIPVYELVTTTINYQDTLTYTFANLANLGGPGQHSVTVSTNLFGDQDNINNAIVNSPVSNSGPTPLSQSVSDSLTITGLNPEGVTSSLIFCDLPGALGPCLRVASVSIDSLTHEFVGQVEIYLISPQFDTLNLSTNNGGLGLGYFDVVFDDQSTNDITGFFSGIPSGIYHPEDSAGFSSFDGQNPNGSWTLWINDGTQLEDGTLYNWSMEFEALPALELGADTMICDFDTLFITADPNFSSYLWWDGTTNNSAAFDANSVAVGSYDLTLTVTDSAGCSAIDTVVVQVEQCTGVEEFANSQMTAYPNPTNDFVTIQFSTPTNDPESLTLFDAAGRVVLSQQISSGQNQVQLDLSQQARGIYFLRYGSEQIKLIKQ